MRPSPVPEDRLLVLLYHNLGPSPGRRGLAAQWTEPEALRAQVRYLREAGHTFVDVRWVLDWVAQASKPVSGVAQASKPVSGAAPAQGSQAWKPALPVSRPTLLTFDDGQANLYDLALPVLEAERLPALVFAVAGRVGGLTDWEPVLAWRHHPLLTWEQMREMQERGLTFGSHTLTHAHLPVLPEADWRRELAESKRVLEAGLGRPVETVAYPYGELTPEIGAAARELGYRLGFSCRRGVNAPDTDPTALRRMNVRRHRGLWLFRRKVARMAAL